MCRSNPRLWERVSSVGGSQVAAMVSRCIGPMSYLSEPTRCLEGRVEQPKQEQDIGEHIDLFMLELQSTMMVLVLLTSQKRSRGWQKTAREYDNKKIEGEQDVNK